MSTRNEHAHNHPHPHLFSCSVHPFSPSLSLPVSLPFPAQGTTHQLTLPQLLSFHARALHLSAHTHHDRVSRFLLIFSSNFFRTLFRLFFIIKFFWRFSAEMARDSEQTSPNELEHLDPDKEARQLLNPPGECVSWDRNNVSFCFSIIDNLIQYTQRSSLNPATAMFRFACLLAPRVWVWTSRSWWSSPKTLFGCVFVFSCLSSFG